MFEHGAWDLEELVFVVGGLAGLSVTTSGTPESESWWVAIRPAYTEGLPGADGWVSLEHLAWAVRDNSRAGKRIRLRMESVPPFVNEKPGHNAFFYLEGWEDPNEFAAFLLTATTETEVLPPPDFMPDDDA